MVKQAYLFNGETIDCNKPWVTTVRDARGHIARTLEKPSDDIEICAAGTILDDDDTFGDQNMNVCVTPRITHVEFRSYGGSTLADLHWSTTRPGALCSFLAWPQELEVRAFAQDSELFSDRIIFKSAGQSRIVYLSTNGMAFKIADNSGKYKNDNKFENDAALPSWLVPKVIGYAEDKVVFQELPVSVLIVQGCSETLLALATLAPEDVDMEQRFLRSRAPWFSADLVRNPPPKESSCVCVPVPSGALAPRVDSLGI